MRVDRHREERSALTTSWRKFGVGRTVGYRRLRALVDRGLLTRARLVYGQPALYVATRERPAWAGIPQVDPARVVVATTRHPAIFARLAVNLERASCVEVWGETRLRGADLQAERAEWKPDPRVLGWAS
jgi:hypothetical protein